MAMGNADGRQRPGTLLRNENGENLRMLIRGRGRGRGREPLTIAEAQAQAQKNGQASAKPDQTRQIHDEPVLLLSCSVTTHTHVYRSMLLLMSSQAFRTSAGASVWIHTAQLSHLVKAEYVCAALLEWYQHRTGTSFLTEFQAL